MPVLAAVLILITGFIIEAALDIFQEFVEQTIRHRFGWRANAW